MTAPVAPGWQPLTDADPTPYHLRPDAPALATCSGCRRSTWDAGQVGEPCGMPQPSGDVCPGTFRAPRRIVSLRLTTVVTYDDGTTATMETAELDARGTDDPTPPHPLMGEPFQRCQWGIDYPYAQERIHPWDVARYNPDPRGPVHLSLDLRLPALDPAGPHLFTITERPPAPAPAEPAGAPA